MLSGYIKRLAAAAAIVFLMLAAAGCNTDTPKSPQTSNHAPDIKPDIKEEETLDTSSLTLCGVEYSYSGSGTIYGEEKRVHITDKEIVYASFFPWEGTVNYNGSDTDRIIIEHQPVTDEQWADIDKAVRNISHLLQKDEGTTGIEMSGFFSMLFPPKTEMVDGSGRSGFYITWRDENGSESTTKYYTLNDRRFYTLLDLMFETAHPTGREIVWYGEPVITGVHVTSGDPHSGKDSGFSFQCTKKTDAEDEWWFFAYYGENKKPVSLSTTVNGEIWERIYGKLTELKPDEWNEGKYGNSTDITLYYDDGKQPHYKPDKDDLQELKDLFLGIISDLKNK